LSIINDRADVAAAAGADGVHVGQRDLPAHAARMVVGSDRIIGLSTHTLAELDAAIAAQPDYIAVGPMHATALKPEYGVSGVEYLRTARARTVLPLVAIGGIGPDNARALMSAGASCVAVCTAIIGAADPRHVAAELLAQVA
jgi:thiamine-phosphate pyrophosphorylase